MIEFTKEELIYLQRRPDVLRAAADFYTMRSVLPSFIVDKRSEDQRRLKLLAAAKTEQDLLDAGL